MEIIAPNVKYGMQFSVCGRKRYQNQNEKVEKYFFIQNLLSPRTNNKRFIMQEYN